MNSTPVSPHIEKLVDHLRSDRTGDITIGDVAGITEVLLTTMRRYFNSLDLSIYDEFRNLTNHIREARQEIAQIRPNDLKEEKIPRAGAELEAIVQATEAATGTIMDAAEEIMSADTEDPEAYQQAVNDACMRIFEACSFQDITGQRITKVVSTLTFIEERLNTLQVAWGPNIDDSERDSEEVDDDEKALLNGPALEGEGIEQDDIDRLLSGDDEASTAPADDDDAFEAESVAADDQPIALPDDIDAPAPEPEVVAEAEAEADSAADGSAGQDEVAVAAKTNGAKANGAKANGAKANGAKANGAKPNGAKKPKAPEPAPAAAASEGDGGESSQAEIDALFD